MVLHHLPQTHSCPSVSMGRRDALGDAPVSAHCCVPGTSGLGDVLGWGMWGSGMGSDRC